LRFVSGADDLSKDLAVGYHGNSIMILQTRLEKRRDVRAFFSRLSTMDLQRVLDTLDRRLDEECNLYLRLDKQSAAQGRMELTDRDDVIQVSAKIESYPSSREKAMMVAMEFLSSLKERLALEN